MISLFTTVSGEPGPGQVHLFDRLGGLIHEYIAA
jgi:hypothetical protein